MDERFDVSVVICTYNRCELLPGAVENALAQETRGARYELIVVDNNSTDRTREVVESFVARGHADLRYVFEGKQGLSHARNAGIAAARAPVIAFTDDDVRVAGDWVARIKSTFDAHPEVDFVGGKVLPRWNAEVPRWLTPEHWSPLALQEHGDTPFYSNLEKRICLVGACLSLRRAVFERVGLFSPDFQHQKGSVSSVDDHELQLRIWREGGRGLYVPELVITAEVQTERMEKAYHRRWHQGQGKLRAMMRVKETEQSATGRLFDVPAHMYKQAAKDAAAWVKCSLSGDPDGAFLHEVRLRFFSGFFRHRREEFRATKRHGSLREIATFVWSIVVGKSPGGDAPREIG